MLHVAGRTLCQLRRATRSWMSRWSEALGSLACNLGSQPSAAVLLLTAIAASAAGVACAADSADPQDRIVESHIKLLGRQTVSYTRKRVDLISGKTAEAWTRTSLADNITFAQRDDDPPTLLLGEDVYVLVGSSWQYVAKASLPVYGFGWLMPIAEWDYDVEGREDDTLDGRPIQRFHGVTQWEGFRVRRFQEFEASIWKDDGELASIEWVSIVTHGFGSLDEFRRNSCTGSGLRLVIQEEFIEDDYFEYVRGQLADSEPLAAACVDPSGNTVSEWTMLSATRTAYTITGYDEPLDTPIPVPPKGYQVPPDDQPPKSVAPVPPMRGERNDAATTADETAGSQIVQMVDNLMRQRTVHFSKEQFGGRRGTFLHPADDGMFRYAVDIRDWTYLVERELSDVEAYFERELSVDGRKFVQMSTRHGEWMPVGPAHTQEEIELQALSPILALKELEHDVARVEDSNLNGTSVERYLALGEHWSPLGGLFSRYDIWVDSGTGLPLKIDLFSQEVVTPPYTVEGFARLFCDVPGQSLRTVPEPPPDIDPLLSPIPPSQPYEAACIHDETDDELAHWRFIAKWDNASRQIFTFTAFDEPVPIPHSLPEL